jgi:hypothetical protein
LKFGLRFSMKACRHQRESMQDGQALYPSNSARRRLPIIDTASR